MLAEERPDPFTSTSVSRYLHIYEYKLDDVCQCAQQLIAVGGLCDREHADV